MAKTIADTRFQSTHHWKEKSKPPKYFIHLRRGPTPDREFLGMGSGKSLKQGDTCSEYRHAGQHEEQAEYASDPQHPRGVFGSNFIVYIGFHAPILHG